MRPRREDKIADTLQLKIKLGYLACDLAPPVIERSSLPRIKICMQGLYKELETCPMAVWLTLIKKSVWEHLEHERFDNFVTCLRPWRLPDDPQDCHANLFWKSRDWTREGLGPGVP